ncbi:MAG TPA: hypothetical protein VK841_20460 [Polyangiaceae bacterium]|nr:hypothetical protein [Polyangiaceae bacterium]
MNEGLGGFSELKATLDPLVLFSPPLTTLTATSEPEGPSNDTDFELHPPITAAAENAIGIAAQNSSGPRIEFLLRHPVIPPRWFAGTP